MKRKKPYIDNHGYEIMWLAEAKTKEEQRNAIRIHERWWEDRSREVKSHLMQLEKDLDL